MRDFTLGIYKILLTELIKTKYKFITFAEFVQEPDKKEKAIILRHDVERLPCQALKMAQIEHESGVKASYYFCCHRHGFDESVIRTIAAMGHEIGYHYEDLSRSKGNFEMAITAFKKNLALLRKLAVVSTICMHGSPFSRFDNRDLWKNFDYHDLGIIGEPYFDIDFNEVMYLTDTGRRWDGDKVSIRDKVRGDRSEVMGDGEDRKQNIEIGEQNIKSSRGAVCDPPVFNPHSTGDIIKALKKNMLPDKSMLTIHPQRWTDNYFFWARELIWQNAKNIVKYIVAKRNS